MGLFRRCMERYHEGALFIKLILYPLGVAARANLCPQSLINHQSPELLGSFKNIEC